ncbi:peptidase M50 [Pelagicoccus enzymogenes]|uniref:peptidase M50 n=1 Tax=Pelagicoccus enzymogenes TaxID=2773457 RepID=UPI00280DD3A8|nr:peptidase M50 [Pelagicoccus enzymogenes]MDQ8198763.1 peptidase M50 [Pelagicoccus enzymogenes]
MSTANGVFDESWYRVKDCRLRLLPGIELVRQRFKGEQWYVVCDKLGHQYFRIRPEAYKFVCHLENENCVEDAWNEALRVDPENSPSQGDVVQLLSQLYRSGLLRGDRMADIEALAEVRKTEKATKTKQQWASFLFLKIPLFNPDPFLKKTIALFSWCFAPFGFIVWLLVLALGIQALALNWGEFKDVSEGLLGLSNLPLLYLAMIITKTLHEFGHAYACRRYGREVPEMGVMLLVFNPLPYMDASASYAYTHKHRRVLVGAAGMYVEIFVAGLAILYWANAGDGTMSRLAYNMAITASVSTILFNLNPLLRFDGYHILTDLSETPNLQMRAQQLIKFAVNRYGFGLRGQPVPANSLGEVVGLTTFFFASWIYRMFLLVSILFFVSKQWLIAGVIIAIVFAVMWLVVPIVKGARYVISGTELMNNRSRAVLVSAGSILAIAAFLTWVPLPHYFRTDGIVQSNPFVNVYAGTAGELVSIDTPSGSMVQAGQLLVSFRNPELEQEAHLVELEYERLLLLIRSDQSVDGAQLEGLLAKKEALLVRREEAKRRLAELQVKAPVSGRWIAPGLHEYEDGMVARGSPLGFVRGEREFRFSAVVRQKDVDRLFTEIGDTAEVKLFGQENVTMQLSKVTPIPAEQSQLPSASLGVMGGGNVGVNTNERSGSTSSEPFFEIRSTLHVPEGQIANHGQRGVARLRLPNLPLGRQWYLRVRQAFQKEYQL